MASRALQSGHMTTFTAARLERVKLHDPGQLIAAVPHLLGFCPADSVVLISHTGPAGRSVGTVLRGDIPPPGRDREFAAELVGALGGEDVIGATAVVVGRGPGGHPAGTGPARGELVAAVRGALAEAGLRLLHALWVPEIKAGTAWSCYGQDCAGSLPDPTGTVLAAASARAGVVTFGSRGAMADLLEPDDQGAIERRSRLLDAAADAAEPVPRTAAAFRDGCAQLRSSFGRFRDGEPIAQDEEVIRLAVALMEPRVRDAGLAMAHPAGAEHVAVAERLWLALVRATPAPERAQPACLLGYSAYVRGDGALAGMAFDNALEADPGNVLAGLLWRALRHGMPPKRLAELGRGETSAAAWITANE